MEKFCPNCGASLAEGMEFCGKCGTKIEGKPVKPVEKPKQTESTPQQQQPIQPPAGEKAVRKDRKGSISMATAVVAIVISIIAIVSGVFLKAVPAGSVGENELADNSVTSAKIADGTIIDADINDAGISKIKDGAIVPADLSSAVTDMITGLAEIANNSITSEKIANDTITTADLANDSVTGDKIVNDTITGSDIATDAVGSDEIAAGAVNTSELANDAVTYDKMAIKIKCGLEQDAVYGDTIYHNLGYIPTSVVVTPVYNYTYTYIGENAVIHANVNNVTATSFDIALWIEVEYWMGMPWFLHKVDGTLDYPAQDVYWIAIYSP